MSATLDSIPSVKSKIKAFSPLRYPGGKQKLVPLVAEIILSNGLGDGAYAEPYAGGAGVAIELLLRDVVSTIYINDLDRAVHAFWWAVLNHPEKLCRLIKDTPLTVEIWKHQRDVLKKPDSFSLLQLGFSMFYLNRCNRSGVLSGGVIGGLDQTGNYKMDARYNKNDLIQRIKRIAEKSSKITLTNLDAEAFITKILPKLPANSLVYLDPPYYHKAAHLYRNHYKHDDHADIAKSVQTKIKIPWIVSYDETDEISDLYIKQRQYSLTLQYSVANTGHGKEILIASDDLIMPDWLSKFDVRNQD